MVVAVVVVVVMVVVVIVVVVVVVVVLVVLLVLVVVVVVVVVVIIVLLLLLLLLVLLRRPGAISARYFQPQELHCVRKAVLLGVLCTQQQQQQEKTRGRMLQPFFHGSFCVGLTFILFFLRVDDFFDLWLSLPLLQGRFNKARLQPKGLQANRDVSNASNRNANFHISHPLMSTRQFQIETRYVRCQFYGVLKEVPENKNDHLKNIQFLLIREVAGTCSSKNYLNVCLRGLQVLVVNTMACQRNHKHLV